METTHVVSRLARAGTAVTAAMLAACASSGPVDGALLAGTGNSGAGTTVSMATQDELANSPVPGGLGGIASRTMMGGPGYYTPIGTETGASWTRLARPTLSGGGPTR